MRIPNIQHIRIAKRSIIHRWHGIPQNSRVRLSTQDAMFLCRLSQELLAPDSNGCLDHQISQRLLLHEENKEVLGHLIASPTRPPVRRRRRDTLRPFLRIGDFRIVHGFSLRAGGPQVQKVDLMRDLRPVPPVDPAVTSAWWLLSLVPVAEDIETRYRIISMVSPTVV